MEESTKEQPTPAVSAVKSKLRYPLRSATKSTKEETPSLSKLSDSSSSKRGRPASTVSKSMGVLDLSAKDKSTKPPRRLSIPAKSTPSPASKLTSNITPISEARSRRSANSQGKIDTPRSGAASRLTASQGKLGNMVSPSYWLNHVKVSESAGKHSISLAFFKLALEAGCKPLQPIRDELKSYVRRHNLAEHGDAVRELFEKYDISDNLEQLQVSETCSQVPAEGSRSSDDEVHSTSSLTESRKLKPKSLNNKVGQASPCIESAKKENNPITRTKRSLNNNKPSASSGNVSEMGVRKFQKKAEKITKSESNKEKEKNRKQGKKKSSAGEEGVVSPVGSESGAVEENKENMDASPAEEVSITETQV